MSEVALTKSIILKANPEAVWEFLTNKDKLAIWFHPAESDLKEHEEFTLVSTEGGGSKKICWGTVLEMSPPNLLKYTFTIVPLNGKMTTVTWRLEAITEGTKLTLTHEGLEDTPEAARELLGHLDKGWDRHLGSMREAAV